MESKKKNSKKEGKQIIEKLHNRRARMSKLLAEVGTIEQHTYTQAW